MKVRAKYKGDKGIVNAELDIVQFEENGIQIMYAPALDLAGYGKNDKEAIKSFNETIEEFFRYTLNKKTLFKELTRLGWKIKKQHRKVSAPPMEALLDRNEQLREIMANHKTFNKYTRNVAVPAFA
jgi:hypothetical protein